MLDEGLCEVCVPAPILMSPPTSHDESFDDRANTAATDAGESFLRALERIPGVGSVTALRLFDAGFRTWDDLANGDTTALMAVPGVGRATARRIVSFVGGGESNGEARSASCEP